jgi:hypothetical protein
MWNKQTEIQKLMTVGAIIMYGGHFWAVATCPGFEQVPAWQVNLAGVASVAAGMALPFCLVRSIQFLTGERA